MGDTLKKREDLQGLMNPVGGVKGDCKLKS